MEKKTLLDKILLGSMLVIFYLYSFIAFGFAAYYNYNYAKNNGFGKWIIIGGITSTAKSVIWPYFEFFAKEKVTNSKHFANAMEYSNKATQFINQKDSSNKVYTSDDLQKYTDLLKLALKEAKLVDIQKLNSEHPNFGNHFKDEYIKSVQLLIDYYDKKNKQESDIVLIEQFQILDDKWGDWFNANLENIKAGNKIEI